MLYNDFERIISAPRLAKYLTACSNDTRKAMTMYRANIRLSTELFSILCLFEVALRNAVDNHYRGMFGSNWIFNAVQAGSGFLFATGCERSRESVDKVIAHLGFNYTSDKAVAELTFGFWTYQFASKEFAAAGITLLNILPCRPTGINHTKVFKRLCGINTIRNRIAHHEPICFGAPLCISTDYAWGKYNRLLELLSWMGIDRRSYLFGIDGFKREKQFIDQLN